MAGRGRGMTLPAWMTKEGLEQAVLSAPHIPGGLTGKHASKNGIVKDNEFVGTK